MHPYLLLPTTVAVSTAAPHIKKTAVFRATQLCRLLLLPDTVTFTRGFHKKSVCLLLILHFVKCRKCTAAIFIFLIAYFDDLAVENFIFQGIR